MFLNIILQEINEIQFDMTNLCIFLYVCEHDPKYTADHTPFTFLIV